MVKMGDVWDRATEFLSDNLAIVMPVVLFGILVPVALQGALAPLAETPGATATTLQMLSLVLSLVTLWAQLAIIAQAVDPSISRATATRTATRRLLPTIGVALLVLAGMIVLMLPIPVVLGLSGYDFQVAMNGGTADIAPGASIFIGLYSVVLVAACLWFAAKLALINPVIVAERRGIGALARSVALTRGITWKIIGVMILFGVVAIVAVLAAKTVFGSILTLIAGGAGPVTVATVLTAIFVAIVSTAFTVLAAAFIAKLYCAVEPVVGAAEPI